MMVSPVTNYAKEAFQAFYTDAEEIRQLMVELLGKVHAKMLLEPSVGEGAFLTRLLGTPALVDAIDIDLKHVHFIQQTFPAWVRAIHADFIDLFVSGTLHNEAVVSKSYDAIICNPPYGLKFSIEYRKQIKKRYPNFYARESYGLFMLLGISLLKPGGRYVFLVPDTFLTSHNHKPLRDFLIKEARPTHLVQFKSKRFESVNFGYGNLSILAGNRQPLCEGDHIQWVDAVDHSGKLSHELFNSVAPTSGEYLLHHLEDGWVYPARKAAMALSIPTVRLGDIAECRTGIYTGDNQHFCGYDQRYVAGRANGHAIEWESTVKADALSHVEKSLGIADKPRYVPLIRGGHREPFAPTTWAINWSQEAVAFYATDKKARLQNASFYFKRGVAVPMVTSGRISASLMEGAVFDQGVVGIFPKQAEMVDFLLIYLNSPFVAECVKAAISPGANNSANYIKRIPVPLPSEDEVGEANQIVTEAKERGWKQTEKARTHYMAKLLK